MDATAPGAALGSRGGETEIAPASVARFSLRARQTLTQIGILPLALGVLTWVVLAPRLVPSLLWDRGIFVSVGERLLAGDTLYSQVWDNKDPFFFYFVAAQRWAGPLAEPIAEGLLLLIAALSVYSLVRHLSNARTAFVIGFIAAPIILTGAFYYPGYTHLPGISLCLAAYALSLRDNSAGAGIAIGLFFFVKLIMVPLGLVLVLCALRGRSLASVSRFLAALALSLLAGTSMLLARSEFYPFLATVRYNLTYVQNISGDGSLSGSFRAHLARIASSGFYVALASTASVLLFAAIAINPRERPMAGAIIAASLALVAAVVILGLTGLWDHHDKILYVPAILPAVCCSPFLETALAGSRAIFGLGLVLSQAFLLGGSTGVASISRTPLADWRVKMSALTSPSPETRRLLALGPSGSYARLGTNDDLGHAAGLRHWKLLCPKFHQYAFQPGQVLDETFACASTSPVLLIANSFRTEGGRSVWNEYVAKVELC